jgi:glycosyltransferase involved in cell wall biosynthesis
MRVAFVYELDAADINVQSGYPYAMLDQLEVQGCEVVPAFPLDPNLARRRVWKKLWYRASGRSYRSDREPKLLAGVAEEAARRLSGQVLDCVFAPGSHAVTCLDLGVPKVFCADATFHAVLGFYDGFSGCAEEYIRQGEAQESLALRTSAAAIYASEWAAQSAINHYEIEPAKVHVVPFGANVVAPPQDEVRALIGGRGADVMNVLFIGLDWRRKGLRKVIETCRWIDAGGTRISLDVVGAEGYRGYRPGFARFHGLLRKSDPVQRRVIERLLGEAHFLFMPSLAENFGIVFCEAAAYGVPSVATNVGGIPTAVRHGVTGLTLPGTAAPDQFGAAMLQIFTDRSRYCDMALAARRDFEKRLNWRSFGKRCMEIMCQAVDEASEKARLFI